MSAPTRTLVLLRHGKSDWAVPVADRERPVGDRGLRQAAEAGDWLAGHGPRLELALVSTARRAMETWEAAAARLPEPPPVRLRERIYTADGAELVALVRRLREESTVALVGHNPAMEEAVQLLTGVPAPMRTATLAVVRLAEWGSAGDGAGRLVAHGRPPLA